MLFICYPKCTTCQKAKAYLDGSGIPYELRDIIEINPSYDELKDWITGSGLPVKKFFNTSGLLYKSLNLKDKLPGMSEDECMQLLATDGMLVKRPLLIGFGSILVGFKQEAWETALIPVKEAMALQAQETQYVEWIRGRFRSIVSSLEAGAELLLDMSAFREEKEGVIAFGYNRLLDSTQTRAQVIAEKFLSSLDDCRCATKLKSRGLSGDSYRAAESKWMKEAAAEIRRVLGTETDAGFWKTRAPL